MRAAAPRPRGTPWRSVGTVLNRVTPDAHTDHFKDAGYASG